MGPILFRSADSGDFEFLIALAKECTGAPHWAVSTWRQIMDSIPAGRRNIVVALFQEQRVGFGVVGISGDVADLENLAVRQPMRGQGIGRNLCEHLIDWAKTRGASKMLLEVRISNMAARALYESIGFSEVAIRRGYYRGPDEDGVTMARQV